MERQQKAYKGVIDYFKRRFWMENFVRGETAAGAGYRRTAECKP